MKGWYCMAEVSCQRRWTVELLAGVGNAGCGNSITPWVISWICEPFLCLFACISQSIRVFILIGSFLYTKEPLLHSWTPLIAYIITKKLIKMQEGLPHNINSKYCYTMSSILQINSHFIGSSHIASVRTINNSSGERRDQVTIVLSPATSKTLSISLQTYMEELCRVSLTEAPVIVALRKLLQKHFPKHFTLSCHSLIPPLPSTHYHHHHHHHHHSLMVQHMQGLAHMWQLPGILCLVRSHQMLLPSL